MTRRGKNVVFIDETSWLNCRYDYNVAWMSNFHVLITLITRRCEDVGFGCRLDFNVVATSNVHVLVTSMTRRGKNVVFIDETSWLNCRCDYNVAWMSNFHVLITLITRRCEDVGLGCRRDFNVVPTSYISTSLSRR